jgi:hypothetical protein
MAEDAAREVPELSPEDALQLVHLYAERGSPKVEKAAMRWLERYPSEETPRLQHDAEVAAVVCDLDDEAAVIAWLAVKVTGLPG